MEQKVLKIASGAEPAFTPQPRPAQPDPAVERQRSLGQDVADLRLVIEKDAGSGSYVYKTVDRRTGEIVQQLPRDQILRMHSEDDYAAGDVVRARA